MQTVGIAAILVGAVVALLFANDLPRGAGVVLLFFGIFLGIINNRNLQVSPRGTSIFLFVFAVVTGLFAFTTFLSNGTPTCGGQPMGPSNECGVVVNGVVPPWGATYSSLIQWYDLLRFLAGMFFVVLIAGAFIYFMRVSNVHKKGLLFPIFITGLIAFALTLILWWRSATTLPDPNPPPCTVVMQCASITVPIPNDLTSNILLLVTLVVLLWPIVTFWRLRP